MLGLNVPPRAQAAPRGGNPSQELSGNSRPLVLQHRSSRSQTRGAREHQRGTPTMQKFPRRHQRVSAQVSQPLAPSTSHDPFERLMQDAEAFLWKDLEHLFDDQGIDSSRYEEAVNFSDPISKFSSLRGYLANISFLRIALSPKFHLHDIRRTGPLELTTRWTMDMELSFNRFNPLKPWYDPKPVFTGTSIMTVNPDTGKFVSHIDTWDAVSNQSYLSLEAVRHLASQVLTLRQTPQDLTTPSYLVLKKMPRYEIRQYEGFAGLEMRAGEAQGQAFQKLAGYLGGKNSQGRKLAMTTPVLTDDKGGMQFFVGADEAGEDGRDLPQASDESIRVTGSPPQIQGVATFSGAANQTLAAAKAAELRNILREDGHTPADATSWQLAQYNSPLVPGFLRRNEVLIPLSDYKLW